MKIYTRAGDDGSTGLLGPGRVPKSSLRVEAYGSVDELSATLGVVRALDAWHWVAADLEAIQSDLFVLGAELATPPPNEPPGMERLSAARVDALERTIDRMTDELPELTSFIVPGGTPLAAHVHVSRTVCRRAERRVVALANTEPVGPETVRYLNRLADLLFVMARWCNHKAGVPDIPWTRESRAQGP